MKVFTCMEVITIDETSQKVIDAAMELIRDKGFVATTTKDIAKRAGVNECTLFRKFKTKKDIVLSGIAQERWRADISPEIFQNVVWELQPDLEMFMRTYMEKITPDFVRLSIGLRAPQIYDETANSIIKIPQIFLSSLIDYFKKMEAMGKLPVFDFECVALTVFSATFGYTFLDASFHQNLSQINKQEFIKRTAATLIDGIPKV